VAPRGAHRGRSRIALRDAAPLCAFRNAHCAASSSPPINRIANAIICFAFDAPVAGVPVQYTGGNAASIAIRRKPAVFSASRFSGVAGTFLFASAFAMWPGAARAAKVTECTRIGICYCVNDEFKPAIASRVESLRQLLAEQRKAGKAVGYLSVPPTSAGGGSFNVNREVAESARAAIEKRFGAEFTFVLNPATPESDLPKGSGAENMLMWTTLLEGIDGFGEFDFVISRVLRTSPGISDSTASRTWRSSSNTSTSG
jgi:hypothetical protein